MKNIQIMLKMKVLSYSRTFRKKFNNCFKKIMHVLYSALQKDLNCKYFQAFDLNEF